MTVQSAILCILAQFYRLLRLHKNFDFHGETYSYFYHGYNKTWTNERSIEVPIMLGIVSNIDEEKILEVGNVLSHYYVVGHDILDKYESDNFVINQDIVNFSSDKKYNLIISISSLEHIGWDERPKDPEKVLKAVQRMRDLLAPGGQIVLTIPLGYNPVLDELMNRKVIGFSDTSYLRKISKSNRWKEVASADLVCSKSNEPYPGTNTLAIATI